MPDRHPYPVTASERAYAGAVIAVRRDQVGMPDGKPAWREVVEHPGAVGVVALDDDDRVLLVEQFRHPVRARLWELPAGLLDVAGEAARDAAARELAEEAGLRADRWSVLLDALTSPGGSDEAIRIYLAEQLSAVPRPVGKAEEADLVARWWPLEQALAAVRVGQIRNAMAVLGLLALSDARSHRARLRPDRADWPDRPGR